MAIVTSGSMASWIMVCAGARAAGDIPVRSAPVRNLGPRWLARNGWPTDLLLPSNRIAAACHKPSSSLAFVRSRQRHLPHEVPKDCRNVPRLID
ncbi:uncharacterized protein BDZ83DRAFT_632257 [Colletotrichum acutatum]|uniref:Uncharacterized protein n=1 Tax=Glomerella acutata TaxID=27357 RepID=A0AAD8XE42_GLOAC|nr:uncharacterized protein BDZ83DRAFT_632257 [Colletotrichum acutatum]KAK1719334.1 hypothetical protein BDZ83DRAFT_632257 [Colletotrichum acutatum]